MSETGRETSPARKSLNAIAALLNSIVGLLSLVMFVLAWGRGWALRDEIGWGVLWLASLGSVAVLEGRGE